MKTFIHAKHFAAVLVILLMTLEVFSMPAINILRGSPPFDVNVFATPVLVKPVPNINGPATVCPSIPVVFTTETDKTNYKWAISAGGQIISGGTTNSVTVAWPANAVNPWISVSYYDPIKKSSSTTTTKKITIDGLTNPALNGPNAVCIGSSIDYTTDAGMSGYVWTVSSGGTIVAGATTNKVTVLWKNIGDQTITVTYNTLAGCDANATAIHVLVNPLPTPGINGPDEACVTVPGNVYTTEGSMTGYDWKVEGGTITSGAGTNSITVTWNLIGLQKVSVNYANASMCAAAAPAVKNVSVKPIPVPSITGPLDAFGMPAAINGGVNTQTYVTEKLMQNYVWTVSAAGQVLSGGGPTDSTITVQWNHPTGQQSVSVNYTFPNGCSALQPTVYIVNYYPFAAEIDPTTIPQFVDPVPHFAAGLRVDAKAGGNLVIEAVPVKQIAVSTGTVLTTGTVGDPSTPNAGKGNYSAYQISTDGGAHFGPAMWPAQTIEALQGHELKVQYKNKLNGVIYDSLNILADQTLMMNGFPQNGNIVTDPYRGPIPMVTHLHGGEIPSNSDGGPTAWFMPEGYNGPNAKGPGFQFGASTLCTYPNNQEETTLWYHPHDQGLTRINVYTGLAGFYFLRGPFEDALHLPGWSGDDKVKEVTPAGKQPTFNGDNTYLPEIELAIQDRMFNNKGELYWPVAPTNPETHPFWTPEFFGDVMTVNGKTWPYLSVAPRKYAFRFLDGCNARFLNLWLMNLADMTNGPKITVVSSEGGFLDQPVVIDPNLGQKLFLAPAERPIVIIDFTGMEGKTFTLMNDAPAPYPTGSPVITGLTDRILQFVVNGQMVSASEPANPGSDLSSVPTNLRPQNPMVKLTDFNGLTNTVPTVKRQLILNEITGAGGPLMVAVNNSHFDAQTPFPGAPFSFGGPTETPREGTTEEWKIINTTVDAHPMHPHLVQWQLVSRQAFDVNRFMQAYAAAWALRGIPTFPSFSTYPGGAGSPFPYNTVNKDGAVGGNPAISDFVTGPVIPAQPEERGWKDAIKALPGQVETYICRVAPTDKPINAPASDLVYSFDPSTGPGYVWHCHIIDHEDMDMMRPFMVTPSLQRLPVITTQPVDFVACAGDVATFTVEATSTSTLSYQWQVSTAATPAWTDIVNGAPGPYTNANTATLSINPASVAMTTNKYRCVLTNDVGTMISNVGVLTVNNCTISGTLKYNNTGLDVLPGMRVTANGKSATTSLFTGKYTITGVTSGLQTVTVNPLSASYADCINSTDAGAALYWSTHYNPIAHVKFLAGDVTADWLIDVADANAIQDEFVNNHSFARSPWSFWKAAGTIADNSDPQRSDPIAVTVNGTSVTLDLLGMVTGDFNGSLSTSATMSASATLHLDNLSNQPIGANQSVDLPILAGSAMTVGAASLVLNIQSDLVQVTDVSVKGSTDKPSFSVVGNELRIGWFTASPLTLAASDEFIILKLRTTASFTGDKKIKLTLAKNPLNEIADGTFNVIANALLGVNNLTSSNDWQSGYSLSANPNPLTSSTTLTYTLPTDGQVTLKIYNNYGFPVTTLVNQNMTAGTYTVVWDASSLLHGNYTASLRVVTAKGVVEKSLKLIVQ